MSRYVPMMVFAFFLIIALLPCQVLPASITQTKAAIGDACTASGDYSTAMGINTTASQYASTAMGSVTTASGQNSTAMGTGSTASGSVSTAMGYYTTASGVASTAMGYSTTAGGFASWAGGTYMQLTSSADHTFVWGHASSAQSISTADAFLIFPVGTSGKVGIGTPEPGSKLDIKGAANDLVLSRLNQTGNRNWSGWRFDRDSSEKWFIGMGNADDKLLFRRTAASNDMVIDATGNVGIGTNPSFKLHVNGNAAGTSWTNLSSREYKEDIQMVDKVAYPIMLAKLADMELATYKYKKEYGGDGNTKLGFIAEDMPDEVLSKDGKGVDLYELLALTIGAIKGQQREVDQLKAENDALRQEIRQIKELLGM